MDDKFPMDSTSTLPNGESFKTPAELRSLLVDELPGFAHCLTEKMLTYALGRGLQRYDRTTVDSICRKLAVSGYRSQVLVQEIVASLPFQARRGEALLKRDTVKAKEVVQK